LDYAEVFYDEKLSTRSLAERGLQMLSGER